jgi:hydroxymethylbilane synthase
MAKHTLIIGTRGSTLALRQAELADKALRTAHPGVSVEISIINTEGDGNERPIPLDVVGKGWFTKEIEDALLAERIDIAAHSLKDLPEQLPPGLGLVAFLPRADARDALVSTGDRTLADISKGARVGTDSERRKVQLLALRPDLNVASIRGNVPTRLKKLDDGLYDAIVLAAAGLERLGLAQRIAQYFTSDEMTPAPGQGTIALETRLNDSETNELLRLIDDQNAAMTALAERAFAKEAGGGCKSPTGAWAEISGETLLLTGMLGKDGGIERGSISGSLTEAATLGARLAGELRGRLEAHE